VRPRWAAACALLMVGCVATEGGWQPAPVDEWALIDASTMLALGRLPRGQGEASLLRDALQAGSPADLMMALTRGDAYRDRWRSALYDVLGVDRIGPRSRPDCFREETPAALSSDLARFVRDAEPDQTAFGAPTMADLVDSALRLDDLSPILRANLFVELANDEVEPDDLEAPGFRRVRANDFTARVLGRTAVCLSCHSSEFSVTDSADPALDRHAPHDAAVDTVVFGDLDTLSSSDFEIVFRRRGVLASMMHAWEGEGPADGCAPRGLEVPGCEGCACEEAVCELLEVCCRREWDGFCAQLCMESGTGCTSPSLPDYQPIPWLTPFGLSSACGLFAAPEAVEPDSLDPGGFLGGPLSAEGSMWEFERTLHAALESVRGRPLPVGEGLSAEEALGSLVALRLADAVWTVATGAPLTVPHGFPRNPSQRDVLSRLADALTRSGWSLRALLAAVAEEEAFSPARPPGPAYRIAPVWNPWSREAEEPSEAGNDVGDRVHPWGARERQNAAHLALEWPPMLRFPTADQTETFDVRRLEDLGAFVGDGAPGFTAVDVQSALAWEEFVSRCRPPDTVGPLEERCSFDEVNCPRDFVDDLAEAAQGAPWRDAVGALRSRLLRDANSSGDAEDEALSALMGVGLDEAVTGAGPLRRACAAMLNAPAFTHWLPRTSAGGPPLVVPGARPSALCARLEAELAEDSPGPRFVCDGASATLRD
jgi:hypothetical protein